MFLSNKKGVYSIINWGIPNFYFCCTLFAMYACVYIWLLPYPFYPLNLNLGLGSSLHCNLSSIIAFMIAVSSSSRADCLVWNGCRAALLGWYAFNDGSRWRPSSLPLWRTYNSNTWVWWSEDTVQHKYGISAACAWFNCFNLHNWKYISCSITIWCLGSFW